MSHKPRIIVVGGGIAGLSTAIFLHRAGLEVVVLERTQDYGPVGSTLELGPNATRLLDDAGVGEALRRVGARPQSTLLLRWQDSSVLSDTPLGQPAEEFFGGPALNFRRAELLEALFEAANPGIIRFGVSITELRQNQSTAIALLDTGEEISADALIGADGINSPIRNTVLHDKQLLYSGYSAYRGLVSREAVGDLIDTTPVRRYWLGPRGQVVAYWGARSEYLGVSVTLRADAPSSSTRSTLSADEVFAFLEGWDALPDKLARRIAHPIVTPIYVRPRTDNWVEGRIALLGDSAHAMTPFLGQGAGQAVEDAYVLSKVIGGISPEEIPSGLERYESIRVPRANDIHRQAEKSGENFYHLPDGHRQEERDRWLKELPRTWPFGTRQEIWSYVPRRELSAEV